jgi:4-amino-4-deoxychorismate lyase
VGGDAALRVRLTLARDGKPEVTTQPFTPLAPDVVWALRIAETRLDANDPLLRHKTTRRAVYDAARAEFSREEADEVILLNQHGEVCEGTITNVFVDTGDGVLLTPSLRCGLLPGVLRGELLESGKAKEAVLTEDDLRRANAIFVGNSLRGLIRAGFGGGH